jgi:hypothetical protein
MKNKPTFAALVKQVTKYLGGAGISASSVGDGSSFKGVKWNETDLTFLPAEFWPQALLSATPELLRVAGLEATARRLNLYHVPFAPTEARIVCALLDLTKPDEHNFASRLSAETDSPSNKSAAEEHEQGSGQTPPLSRARAVGHPTDAPLTVWTVKPRPGDAPKPPEPSAKSATDAQRVASAYRALSAHVEGLQSDMPLATAAMSPYGHGSLQRLHVNLFIVLLDDLKAQDIVFQEWVDLAMAAEDDDAAQGNPPTTLVAELTKSFDRTLAKIITKRNLGPGSPHNYGGLFDSAFGLVRKGEAAALVAAKHFAPTGTSAASALNRSLDMLDFAHGGALNLSHAVSALTSAISDAEESGVAYDAALTLARIEAKIAISSGVSEMIPLVTEAGAATFWAVWAHDRANAGALRGAAPVSVEDVHDLMDELSALAVSQSKQQRSRAQAIAAGRAAGSQEASHDTAARVNNVSALSSASELCSTAGCGKPTRHFHSFCRTGHLQPGFVQCSECKLLLNKAMQYCPRALTHGCQGQPPFLPVSKTDEAKMSATVKRMWQDKAYQQKNPSPLVALAAATLGSAWGHGGCGSPEDWGL